MLQVGLEVLVHDESKSFVGTEDWLFIQPGINDPGFHPWPDPAAAEIW